VIPQLALAVDAHLEPVAVHVDHGLRAGSGADAHAVSEVAARLGAGFLTTEVEIEPGSNLEARARVARYDALELARTRVGAGSVLVAHTADDQAETVLLNVLRGAAAAGLAGMARHHGTVVRPLLGMRRADTRALCATLGLPVLDDPMNDDPAFRRVAVRRDVLPLLETWTRRQPPRSPGWLLCSRGGPSVNGSGRHPRRHRRSSACCAWRAERRGPPSSAAGARSGGPAGGF
jgi:tRNA(Ile)-lysidine synthetase-like protein